MSLSSLRVVSWSDGRRSFDVITDPETAQHLWEVLRTRNFLSHLSICMIGGPKVDPQEGQRMIIPQEPNKDDLLNEALEACRTILPTIQHHNIELIQMIEAVLAKDKGE